MNTMHIHNPITPRAGIFLSAVLLVMPALCWFSVLMFVVFGQSYFMNEVVARIDSVSSLFTISILVGFPLFAIVLINLPNLDLMIERTNSIFQSRMKIKISAISKIVTLLSILLIISALLGSFRG